MTIQQAQTQEQVWKLYMAESMTFEMVAEMDFSNFVDIVFCDFNVVPMERARSIAIICKGYAVRRIVEAAQEAAARAEALDRKIEEELELIDAYYDADELFCLANPGILM